MIIFYIILSYLAMGLLNYLFMTAMVFKSDVTEDEIADILFDWWAIIAYWLLWPLALAAMIGTLLRPKKPNPRIAQLEFELDIHRKLIRAMLENDPDEIVADGGVTMLMIWRKDAHHMLDRKIR